MLNTDIALEGHLETVQQAKDFLSNISKQDYQAQVKPHLSSSVGGHMRHVLDHYLALKDGLHSGLVNYNKRRRQSDVESCPLLALKQWQDIEVWLKSVNQLAANRSLSIICETSVNKSQNIETESTLGRELVFVASHAIHHFSLMAVINSLLGNTSDTYFGVAPSTATYLRQRA